MSIGRRLLVAVALIVALGVPVVALAKPAAAPVTVSGDITLTTPGSSGGNRMVVVLREHIGNAVIERAWAEVPLNENALPPYHYTLSQVDSSVLSRPGSTYSIRAAIALRTSIRFEDSRTYTSGTTLSFQVKPSTGYLPYTASGDGWLLIGLILASLAIVLAGWRWLRMRPLVRRQQLA